MDLETETDLPTLVAYLSASPAQKLQALVTLHTLTAAQPAVVYSSLSLVVPKVMCILQSHDHTMLKTQAVVLTHGILSLNGKSLIREVITPRLPALIQSLLDILNNREENDEKLLASSVWCLNKIIPNHPTTFRPFSKKYFNSLISVIKLSDFQLFKSNVKDEFCKGIVLLHLTATKNNESQEWKNALENTISCISKLIMKKFEKYITIEDNDLKLELENLSIGENFIDLSLEEESKEESEEDDINKLKTYILLLSNFFKIETKSNINLPLKKIINFIKTCFNLNFNDFLQNLKYISKFEKNKILNFLNQLHFEITNFLILLIDHLKHQILPFIYDLSQSLEMILFPSTIISKNNHNESKINVPPPFLIEASFLLISKILDLISLVPPIFNPFISRVINLALSSIELKAPSLDDLTNKKTPTSFSSLENNNPRKTKHKKTKNNDLGLLSDIVASPNLFTPKLSQSLVTSIEILFNSIIQHCFELSGKSRIDIYRYSILTCNEKLYNGEILNESLKDLIISCSLYPSKNDKISIAQLIAKLIPSNSLINLLIHPRLPLNYHDQILKRKKLSDEQKLEDEECEQENEQDEHEEKQKDYDEERVLKRTRFGNNKSLVTIEKNNIQALQSKTITVENTSMDIDNDDTHLINVQTIETKTTQTNLPKMSWGSVIKSMDKNDDNKDADHDDVSNSIEIKNDVNQVPNSITTTVTNANTFLENKNRNEDNDSDFEMPEIDVGLSDFSDSESD